MGVLTYNSLPHATLPQGQEPQHPLNGKLGGPHIDIVQKRKIFFMQIIDHISGSSIPWLID
jgi:hypothetical protein